MDEKIDWDKIINMDSINRMKEQINLMGNDKVWEVIERFPNVKTRLAYRRIFF